MDNVRVIFFSIMVIILFTCLLIVLVGCLWILKLVLNEFFDEDLSKEIIRWCKKHE